jgi:hypothetical protein
MNKFLQSLFAGLLLMVMFATKLNAQVAPIFQGADDQSAIGNSTSLSVAKPTNLNPGDFNGTPNTGGTTATPGISSSFTVSGVDVTNINFGITPCSVLNAGTDQTRFISAGTATLTGSSPTTGTWTAQAGNPAGATVGSTTAGVATVTFTAGATGTFNFVYTNGSCTDTMSITIVGSCNPALFTPINFKTLGWQSSPLACGTTPSNTAQTFANWNGTGVSATFSYSTDMWDGDAPNVYLNVNDPGGCDNLFTAGLDDVHCASDYSGALRITNNNLNTGETFMQIDFSQPVILDLARIGSISAISTRFEWVHVVAYNASNVIVPLSVSNGSGGYVDCSNTFTSGQINFISDGNGGLYINPNAIVLQGNSLYGNADISLSTPISKLRIEHWLSPNNTNPASRTANYSSISINALCVSLPCTQPNAGADQTRCQAAGTATLTGTSPTTGTWTAQAGNPAGATVGSTTAGVATVTFTAAAIGTFNFIYTATGGCTDVMSIVVADQPNAGADQARCQAAGTATLTGTSPTTGTWTAQAGNPAGATVGSTTAGVATVTFTAAATGTFNFVYTNGSCTDVMSIVVTAQPDAGADQARCQAAGTATLTGTSPTTGTWTAQAGNPAGATVGSTTAGVATVTFTAAAIGTFNFIYTATGGCTDVMSIVVADQPNAGADQARCQAAGTATLTGTSPTTGTWTAQAGNPAGATVGSTTAGVATVTFTAAATGTFNFVYTNGSCTDVMSIVVTAQPDAGADQARCQAAGTATLTGTSPTTGTWTAQAGNPAGATVGSTTAGVATVTFTAAAIGTFNFIYTATGGCTDVMSIVVADQPNAGADQARCQAAGTATLTGTSPTTGTWTAQAGNPAGATVGSTTAGVATVTFTAAATGTFNFVYTDGSCTDVMSIVVTAQPDAGADQARCQAAGTATLTGTSPTTGTWTAQAGNPAGATVGSTTAGVATVTFTAAAIGTFNFIYTATGGCTDVMSIVVADQPNAGADPAVDGTRQHNFSIINFTQKTILIGGSGYTGEIKKGIFTVLNFVLPHQKNVLSMHCSANIGKDGDTALFFGLSGTGKTTLSADPNRKLIGDDEHGWSDNGVFNFEGGCYAKTIDLSEEKEPDIYRAIKSGAILENIGFYDGGNVVNYEDVSRTENTRVSYPIDHIDNIAIPSIGSIPKNIFFLSYDAYGVLPPISMLDENQAMYLFISGYTSKVAGTEAGVTEPQTTFSACFGAAFLPLHPTKYAEMLGKKIKESGARVWLINTGMSGGVYGVGKRMSLKYTRALITEALNGDLDKVAFENCLFLILKFQRVVQVYQVIF